MNLLIQKLREGETEYQDGPEEGQLVAVRRPPTRTSLWAANELERLNTSIENLGLSYNALMNNYTELQETYNQCLQSIQKLTENLQAGEQMPISETTNSQETQSEPNLDQNMGNQS